MIEIEHGCNFDGLTGKWSYVTITSPTGWTSDVKMTTYEFTVNEGERPDIGDSIDGGKLIKRTTPKVNSDWSRWKDKDLYGNP